MKHLYRRLIAAVCVLALCLTPVSALSVEDALGLLEMSYVDELPAAAYEAATLDELFAAIGDPYTYYMDAVGYAEFTDAVESETSVTGIGVSIEYAADGIRIVSVLPGGSAEEAGIKPGDLIVAVGGVSCVPANEAHRSLIIGEAGTFVTVTVRHPDGTERDYRLERRLVEIHNTTVTLEDGVGVIDCDSFGSQTSSYFADGIAQNDDRADHWVVDLRGNTGGVADTAVGALGVFTGSGTKLYFRDRDGYASSTIYLLDAATGKPAIVLVDGWSASASEILAGGILAENAGIVIGSRTFGKGTAQIVYDSGNVPDLFDGDSLKVTAYRFYCSGGNTTDKVGVIPTLLVSDEQADAVAGLLSAEQPKSGSSLRLMLNGKGYYVDLTSARSSGNRAALDELLSALPPDAVVALCGGDSSSLIRAEEAVALYGSSVASRWFSDVAQSPYAVKINALATYGILGGDGAGRFFPARSLTRAELAAMLAQALRLSSDVSTGFTDVSDESWYAGAVNAAASLGFMGGIGDNRFDPDGTLTQEQFITVMGRVARFLNFHMDDYALAMIEENLVGEEFSRFAPWARVNAHILTGYNGSMLYDEIERIEPRAAVTREQAAATLYAVLKTLGVLSY